MSRTIDGGGVMASWKIRHFSLSDVECVFNIETDSFPTPWEEDIFFHLALSGGIYRIDDTTTVIMDVMGEKGLVNGYIVWEESREESLGHILNLAIRKEFRQKGRGTRLLEHALTKMRGAGMETCELEVRESNHWARHLYECAGMIAVDRRVGYYDPEDAIIYTLSFT